MLAAGRYGGKVVCVGSEGGDDSFLLIDRGGAPSQYRYFGVAGTSHAADPEADFFGVRNNQTSANWKTALRAHFTQADRWVRHADRRPSPGTNVRVAGYDFARDANGNAFTFETLAGRVASTVIMLGLMYLNTYQLDHVFFSEAAATQWATKRCSCNQRSCCAAWPRWSLPRGTTGPLPRRLRARRTSGCFRGAWRSTTKGASAPRPRYPGVTSEVGSDHAPAPPPLRADTTYW